MAYNQHPDDQPPTNWKRQTSEGESRQAYFSATGDPAFLLGVHFCSLLDDESTPASELARLVTPESRKAWGDFREVGDWFRSLKDVGYGSIADRALGDDAVAYFKVIPGTVENYQVRDEQIVSAIIVTVVNRADLGGWRVHGIGDYFPAEAVPH
ncbi:hypothetical protein SB659_07730 [Arthrobacter sp. SIMBA_036]|uniref:hypothetical protein n=1 Tax=Arthrobacter sp. SIMBA_036 TaxID=3085778 RepID=UPI003978EE46